MGVTSVAVEPVARAATAPPVARPWALVALAGLDPAREWPYWLALSAIPGVGPVAFARLVALHGSAEAAWRRGAALLAEIERASPETALALERTRREGVLDRGVRLDARLAKAGARAVTAIEPDYPAVLRDAEPRPPVLYVRGDLGALDGLCVAVVGTRRPSGYGRSIATEIADELARAGATVVSGLAVGIDAAAHTAAIDAGGRTAAVLPSPLEAVYPPRNRPLARRLVAAGGVLISEVPPDRPVGKPDFARRNRVMAAASQATVVVEAPNGSGALLTASAALDHGRELYAVPGPIDAAASAGCNRLIADHAATMVTSPLSLLHQLGTRRPGGKAVSVGSLSEAEGIVLAAVLRRSASIEELIERTKLPTASLAGALTLLEARELVSCYGGSTFHPTLDARRMNRDEALR